jgi:twinkle protein
MGDGRMIKYADIRGEIKDFRTNGLPAGLSTGWDLIDKHYRPERGYMTILTGVPGHGKSEWWDCLMCNMVSKHGLKWVIFSPENYPISIHWNKLAEKFIGKPQEEVCDKDYRMACSLLDEYFTWIYPKDDECTLTDILYQFKAVKDTFGADGFVIDPWNEIDHQRPSNLSETEYISQSLTKTRRFCRENNMIGCVVAHPTKLQKDKDGMYPVPGPWDISGSAHWRNKADFCITVHRKDITKNEPMVYIQKVKQKNFGKVGEIQMYYDYKSGLIKDSLNGIFRVSK